MSSYKMPFDQYKKLQKMSKNEFSRWVDTFARKMYEEGHEAGKHDVHEKLNEAISSVKGVGPILCKRILDKISEI